MEREICCLSDRISKTGPCAGILVSDKEVQKVVDYLIEHNGNASYSEEVEEHVNSDLPSPVPGIQGAGVQDNANEQECIFCRCRTADH